MNERDVNIMSIRENHLRFWMIFLFYSDLAVADSVQYKHW